MAKLKLSKRRDATPRGDLELHVPDRSELPDGPTVVATERMWRRSTRRLAYAAGAEVPEAELPLLIGDNEFWKGDR